MKICILCRKKMIPVAPTEFTVLDGDLTWNYKGEYERCPKCSTTVLSVTGFAVSGEPAKKVIFKEEEL